MYILGNRTAELIEASDQGVHMINTVVTRSKGICSSLERGKETSDGVLNENRAKLAEFVSPSEGEEKDSLEIPAFEEGEMSLAELKGSEFIKEQRKCLDLKQLWDKAQTEGDTEFKIIRGRLVRVARTRRGEEIRQLVVKWCKRFLERRELLEDNARPGQAHRVIPLEMIAKVNAVVLDNHRITVDEIHRLLGISMDTTPSIMHQHLTFRKICGQFN
ncbi:uncharacterized protein TNCT_353421 [Trichonephila clavata]|uniref:Uncharacterized protein n=1 Tax=Trichonephila clavata TaxID=2740835 RepID=A0A8X6GLU8_TRICU|nr:uncharacterized protein TNCT_353421 [Trichonephila clavata]